MSGGPLWMTAISVGGRNPELGLGSISSSAYDGTRLYVAGVIRPSASRVPGEACWRLIRTRVPSCGSCAVTTPPWMARSPFPGWSSWVLEYDNGERRPATIDQGAGQHQPGRERGDGKGTVYEMALAVGAHSRYTVNVDEPVVLAMYHSGTGRRATRCR